MCMYKFYVRERREIGQAASCNFLQPKRLDSLKKDVEPRHCFRQVNHDVALGMLSYWPSQDAKY